MEKLDPKTYVHDDVDMRAYINQLVEELRKDIEVYEKIKALKLTVGEVKDNIARLTDYRNDYNYCKKCPGIDNCEKTIPHLQMVLIKDGSYLTSSYEPCDKIVEKIKLDNRYLYADFPEEWKYSSSNTMDHSKNRMIVLREFSTIIKQETSRWLYILGNHKVGKSFLATALANDFSRSFNCKIAVIDTPKRVKELADLSYKDKEEFAKRLLELCNVPLLVMDDFGEEYKNEYIRDTIMIPLLSEREHKGLYTFFTSEFTIAEIQKMYSIGQASGEIRGKQLARLLKEMCVKEFDISGVALYRR